MNIKYVLGQMVLALVTSAAFASEPASLSQVKTIILRYPTKSDGGNEEGQAMAAVVLTEMESRLAKTGVSLTNDDSTADAEMLIALNESSSYSFNEMTGGGTKYSVSVGVRVLALPSRRPLFAATAGNKNDELDDACTKAAKGIVKKFAKAWTK